MLVPRRRAPIKPMRIGPRLTAIKTTYCEPTVMWRLGRASKETACAVIVPTRRDATLLWWVNSKIAGVRDFPGLSEAVAAAEELRNSLHEEHWTDVF
jgi:hypothetical protein